MELMILLITVVIVIQLFNTFVLIALARTNVKLVEWLSGATEDDEEDRLKQARLEYWARQTGYDQSMLKAMLDSRDSHDLDAQPQNYDGVNNYPKRKTDSLSDWIHEDQK